jgi:murein DD-endopeptidase MepM/ murein hydrolase activator NlpD
MRASLVALAAVVALVASAAPAAANHKSETDGGGSLGADPADPQFEAPEEVRGRVCPTKDFWIGDGWGADRGNRKHRGIDLHSPRGTAIFAVEDGRIDRTKKQSNGSLQIVMKGDGGPKYYYGHMDEVLVDGGDRVTAGQVIGLMGDTGSPGSVHLHFEYWRSGGESAAIDPAKLIERICPPSTRSR